MKRIGLVCIAAMAASVMAAQDKIAVVNMVDLVRFHPSRERDRKLMQDTEKDFQSRLDKQRDRFEELRGEYEKAVKEARSPALNDKAKNEAEEKAMRHRDVLAEADRDLRQEMQKLQRELGELDTRLLRQVTGDIREVLTKFAQEGKYSMILDGTTMAYHDPAMDVTDAILKRMGVDPKVRQEDKDKEKAEKPAAADGK
ncbi:MAG: OmpH family outer membrane protein [Kiritimatiellae bacterium]|nr:OmpH family outer membrane protein [Kiritimatiellia bacterium]MDD3544839.1 OmpH family outer membrane protein [Kiritimatiellia bacterium]MDD4024605.1 OmpH family outer membrane protein [Kiritimatiellia bacterium]MDD4621722.1 OmpH family outer membrane protein [Kiritimatiellia bacterium]